MLTICIVLPDMRQQQRDVYRRLTCLETLQSDVPVLQECIAQPDMRQQQHRGVVLRALECLC
jgi:hypothetical protein